MRDFSEYNDSLTDKMKKSGEKIFEKQLKYCEGHDVEITYHDGSKIISKCQILNHLNDTNTSKEQRILNSRISDNIKKGCLVKTLKDNKTYLVLSEVDNHYSYDSSTMIQCNNVLRFSWLDKEIPCYSDKSSYGVKIFRADSDFQQEADTNLLITIQRNEYTESIDINHRFILGKSKHGLWKIGKIGVDDKGLLVLTCKNDKYLEGLDDIENGIAYQGNTDNLPDIPQEPTGYEIIGEDEIKVNQEYTYELNPSNNSAIFSIVEYSEDTAEIINQSNSSCTIKATKSGEIITLNCEIDGVIVSKDILTVRR